MKVVSFNTNSIRTRLHQLEAVIKRHDPEVIGIQETKVTDEDFPLAAIEALGYQVAFHGQKSHYGVCLMSKRAPLRIDKGFPDDTLDAQRRVIIGQYETPNGPPITIINGYFPQGENIAHDTKFPAKRKFYADLQLYLEAHCDPSQPLLVMGDMNISPQDCDIGIGEDNRKRWLRSGKTSFQPMEREWLARIEQWGLVDSFRHLHPQVDDRFSWFDYRSRGFEREPKRGLRIDLILATSPLLAQLCEAGIDYEVRGMERPSDHAPVWASFDL